jgi:glyoxylate/hydroxypyruvate reductase A
MTFLYKSDPVRGAQWARLFAEKAPHIPFRIWPDGTASGDAEAVRYLAVWEAPRDLATLFPNLEVVFSVGAGIDQFDLTAIPAHLPVVRMIEPGIVTGMVEYVTLATLALHRDWLTYAAQQREGRWQALRTRVASERRVGVLGLGVLGQAVLTRLASFGFQCAGWSRSSRALDGIECFAGAETLPAFLTRTDILAAAHRRHASYPEPRSVCAIAARGRADQHGPRRASAAGSSAGGTGKRTTQRRRAGCSGP